MSIKQFELMHGAVILKICRNDRPLALTLIESDGTRATYRVNDVFVYVKHSASPQGRSRSAESVWQFAFSREHMQDLAKLSKKGEVYLALVCANENLRDDMEVAFLYPEEVRQGLDWTATNVQTLHVYAEPRKRLRVCGRGPEMKIQRNRLDTWDVPNR